MQPPIVPGLTDLPDPSPGPGLGAMLEQLMGDRGNRRTAAADLQAGMAALRQAAEADPRLAERIRQALAVIEGTEPDGGNRAGPPRRDRLGPMAGRELMTPI